MPTLSYTEARRDSVSALATLNAALLEARSIPVLPDHRELEHRMTGYLADGYRAVLFTWDDRVVGYCLYYLYPKYAYIRHFHLEPVSRKVTTAAAFDLLRSGEFAEYASVRMDLAESAKETLRVWESIGFRPRSVRLELQTATKRKTRKSCGSVIYRRVVRRVSFLVVQHENGGHWDFPKGHVAEGETEMETARREVAEETGLHVGFREGFYERIYYLTPKDRRKDVVYFLSRARRQRVRVQSGEIREHRWLPYWKARELLTYENAKLVLDKAHAFIAERGF